MIISSVLFFTFALILISLWLETLRKIGFKSTVFKKHQSNFILVFIATYTYLNMFNFIRGGSAFIIGMVIPICFLLVLLKKNDNNKIGV